MAAFDHVTILFSFVYALALTHVLARLSGLLLAHKRVRFSWLPLVWMTTAILLVFANWLSLWDARTLQSWSLFTISMQLLLSVALYFICAVVAPEFPAHGKIDMEAIYAETRVPLFWSLLALCLFGIAGNFSLMQINLWLFLNQSLVTLIFAACVALPLAVRARWAQWTGAIACLLLSCAFLGVFEGALR